MKIKAFRALHPNFNLLTSPDSFTSEIKKNFKELLASGLIEIEKKPAFFIYRIMDGDQAHTGLITGTDIREYLQNNIKKHEQTLNAREQTQLNRILQWNTTLKPILLVYKKVPAIAKMLRDVTSKRKPDFEVSFESSPQIHKFWRIEDKNWHKKISALFKEKVKTAYIADGHHRIAGTAALYEKFPKMHYDQAFTAYFSFDEVTILPYNRVISNLHGKSPARFIAELSQFMKIKPLTKPAVPRHKHQITMLLRHEWYRLEWRKRKISKLAAGEPVLLDSHLLNLFVFSRLGIKDPRSDRRITYVGGNEGLEGIIRRVGDDPAKIGFCLYPVDIAELVRISDLDKTLPPKSTWFEPRLKNGLIMKAFE